jgi:hypothetical protein
MRRMPWKSEERERDLVGEEGRKGSEDDAKNGQEQRREE